MLSAFFMRVQPTKNLSLIRKKIVILHRYEKDVGLYLYRVQKVDSGKRHEGKFLREELFAVRNNVK